MAKATGDPATMERIRKAILEIVEGKTRKVELNAELNGTRYVIIAYRLNDQIPVRVDWKVKS